MRMRSIIASIAFGATALGVATVSMLVGRNKIEDSSNIVEAEDSSNIVEAEDSSMERGAIQPLGSSRALGASDLRVAIANQACPQENETGYHYIKANCKYWITRGNWCACVTDSEDPLIGEVASIDTIPDSFLKKAVVCRDDTGDEQFMFVDVDATTPPGWECVLILQKVLFKRAMRNVKTRLYNALETLCCGSCTGECLLRGNNWGQCPECLLSGNTSCEDDPTVCRVVP